MKWKWLGTQNQAGISKQWGLGSYDGSACILQNTEWKKEIFNKKSQQVMPNMNIKKHRYNKNNVSVEQDFVTVLEAEHLWGNWWP